MENTAVATKAKKPTSQFKKKLRKFCNNRLAMIGFIVLVIMIGACIAAPLLTQYDQATPDFSALSQAPSQTHIFGTDSIGRDIFARTLYGGRISIMIAVVSAVIGAVIGCILGAIAGYFGGKVDWFLVRICEIWQTIPQLLLVMLIMAFIGQGTWNLVLIFAFSGWMGVFRMVRGEFLSAREETYVQVCRAFGMSKTAIMFKQILPSVLTTVVITFTLDIPGYMLTEATLSFLGVGVPMSTATWGTMLNASRSVKIITNCWWAWVIPGACISLFVMATNFLGDGLRDILDPRQQ